MGRTVKARKKKKYMYNVNRRKVQQKRKQKVLPLIPSEAIRSAWDGQKHTKANLEAMGLAYKMSSVMPAPSNTSDAMAPPSDTTQPIPIKKKKVKRPQVVEQLQELAARPRPRQMRLPQEQVRFVEYMMDKHGEDFGKMARDARNHFQLTPKQIRRLANRFWDIPEHYASYMKRKGMLKKPEMTVGDDE